MAIDAATLSSLATEYSRHMTTTRGKRVQRLLKREFAGADCVLRLQVALGPAVLGLSATGAALCATNGRGRRVSVVKWLHGSQEAFECHFDLLKDSLPLLSTESVPVDGQPCEALRSIPSGPLPPAVRTLVDMALRA